MDHLEMVEKLREKANVSYEEASAALEKCNWDLLDALLLLEGEGRLHSNGTAPQTEEYTTRPKPQKEKKENHGGFAMLMHGLAQVIRRLNTVQLLIKKNGEVRLELPMSVVLLLVIISIWAVAFAAIIAMFFGYRFAVKGLSFDEPVNAAMDKAGNFVDDVAKAGPTVVIVDASNEDDENGTVE